MKERLKAKFRSIVLNQLDKIRAKGKYLLFSLAIILLLVAPYVIEETFGILSGVFVILATLIGQQKWGLLASSWSFIILIFILTSSMSRIAVLLFVGLLLFISLGVGSIVEYCIELIKELNQTKQKLTQKSNLLDSTLQAIQDGISVHNPDLTIRYTNAAMKRWYEKNLPLEGQKCFQVYHNREEACEDCPALKSLQTGQPVKREVYNTVNPDIEWMEVISYPIKDKETGAVTGVVESVRDITEQKKAEEKIKYLSFHDELTELYNRTYVEEEMERLNTERQLPISIIMIDVNGLKLVNDTFGHKKGDELLIKTAEVLQKSCREEDIIARFGGDEFIILLPQTKSKEAVSVRKRIKQNCKAVSVASVPLSIAVGEATKETTAQDLWETCKEADEKMYKHKLTESRSAKSSIVKALLNTLEEKSAETAAHAIRLQKMAFELGQAVNLSITELDRLSLVAALHDIGKVTVPGKVLTKAGSLEEEWQMIKEHPKVGYRIASSTEDFAHVAAEILYHHEYWDGTGYPEELEGKKIPLLSRIIAIVDAYDVMATGRPYKSAMPEAEIKQELKRCAGTQFDPELVEVFLDLIREDQLGVEAN